MGQITENSATSTGAETLVRDGFDRFVGLAEETFENAQALVEALTEFDIPDFHFDIPFEIEEELGAPFAKPDRPDIPDVDFTEPATPADIALSPVDVPDVGDAPEFGGVAPIFSSPAKPDALTATAPGDEPTVSDIVLPETPDVTLPAEPSMRQITIPDAPTIELPTFDDELPLIDFDSPIESFNFTEQPYSSLLLAETTARVRTMLAGGTGLPAIIEEALFGRARVREDLIARKATAEVIEEWASRGHSLPGGELNRRLDEVRQTNQDKVSNLSRDIMIEAAKWEIENLRFSVQQGIALESMLINYHNAVQQRAFEVARYMLDAQVQIFNAKISLYNARLNAYGVQAQVFKTRIEAALAAIEVYKAQLEGAKLINEINELDVRIYAQKIQALNVTVDLYRAQLEGVKAQVDVDRGRVDLYKARVEAFAQIVAAKRSEFEAWGEEIRGETAKFTAFEAEARAFAAEVDGFRARTEAMLALPRFNIELQKLTIDKYQADIQRYAARVDAEARRVQSMTALFEGEARMYSAELGAESARVSSDTRHFELGLERAKAQAQLGVETIKIRLSQIQEEARLLIEALRGAAAVSSQLAAGTMSAVNLSAQIADQSQVSASANNQLEGDSAL